MRLLSFALAVLLFFAGLAASQETAKAPENKPPDALHELSTALEGLSERTGRAVVQVFSTGFALNEEEDSGDAALLTKQKGTGSGVILSADGYIVTNAHVVKGGRQIQVQLAGSQERLPGHSIIRPLGTKIDAKVVGIDRDTDLALIKIDRTTCLFFRWAIPTCSRGNW